MAEYYSLHTTLDTVLFVRAFVSASAVPGMGEYRPCSAALVACVPPTGFRRFASTGSSISSG